MTRNLWQNIAIKTHKQLQLGWAMDGIKSEILKLGDHIRCDHAI